MSEATIQNDNRRCESEQTLVKTENGSTKLQFPENVSSELKLNKYNKRNFIKEEKLGIELESSVVAKTVKSDDYFEEVKTSDSVKVPGKVDSEEVDDGKVGSLRESRLTSIIDQLRCANKLKGYTQRGDNFNQGGSNGPESGDARAAGAGGLMLASLTTRRDLDAEAAVVWPAWCYSGEGGGGGARRCVRDASSPSHAQPPAPPAPQVKTERLSPHDNTSSASRSRSVTPSTSSYPGTPPERGSPHPAAPPRNYSDIMRSLAARYNTHHGNDYFHRLNGFAPSEARPVQTSPRAEVSEAPLGGLFTGLARQQGGPPRLPAFPVMLDMSSTKTLLAISRVGRGGRARRKRTTANTTAEHSPLDLSAASESAAKRARLSASPSTRSDSDEHRTSGDDRSEPRADCLCSEARARLSAWSVDDVCDFVNSIDICAEYVTNFREQRIDGSGLPLLTEDHLTGMLQMKLGPALKLRAVLARRLEPCATCANATNAPTIGAANMATKMNGSTLKSEPRSNTTSPS